MGALYQPAWTLGQHSSTDGETINSWVIIIIPCSVELNKLSEAMCSFPFRKKHYTTVNLMQATYA